MIEIYLDEDTTYWDALIAYETERYTPEEAEEEVVARCCEQFLAKSTFVNAFAHSKYKSARNIAAFLMRMDSDMNRLFSDVDERRVTAAAAPDEEGKVELWNTDLSPEQDILNQIANVSKIAEMWKTAVNHEHRCEGTGRWGILL